MSEPSKTRRKKPNCWRSKQNDMNLKIITPRGVLYNGEADAVTFPGVCGSFDVLPGHAPLIAALGKGTIEYWVNQEEKEQTIDGGFVKVENDKLSVCIE